MGHSQKKAKIVDRGSLSSAPERTGSKLQYEPLLRSAFLDRVIRLWEFWVMRKLSFTAKAKIVDGGSLCSAPETTGSKLQYEPYLFSVVCSKTKLSISVKNLGDHVKGLSPKC